ncbi:MAG: imidazole glycerol phosphate synthase subunit HisH [Phycisphaerae bacterium SM23_30]|nr:MAG: imidazole glycerol phosphate synthase subunit HisH [Phycisphaerae bacterium SM23_30]
MITIVDYGMGNLHSVLKAFEHIGAGARISSAVSAIASAEKVVLPGVGAFADAMEALGRMQLVEPLLKAIEQGKPFLGICLGMQLLFEVSYEDGEHPGLAAVAGEVRRFDFSDKGDKHNLKIPHMGWNTLDWQVEAPLLRGLEKGCFVYFVHSYYVICQDESVIATTTDYGGAFTSSIWRDNVYAVQFHPEKSQRAGLQMLKNFAEL